MKTKSHGKGIVKALGQKNTTGNFKKIEKEEGKGAAIGALQNKLAKIRGQKVPYGGKAKHAKKRSMPMLQKTQMPIPSNTLRPIGLGTSKGPINAAPKSATSIAMRKSKAIPQRKNHRSMSGMELLGKGMKKLGGGHK